MKPLKLWACIGPSGIYDYSTFSYNRKISIIALTSSWGNNSAASKWEYWKLRGWRCVKVEVTIKEIK